MKTYVVYFRYKRPGEKTAGNVSHQKIQANSLEEARELAKQHTSYPGVTLLRVKEV